MNRLINKAPESIIIDEIEYPINTDFRDCLITVQALQDDDLTNEEKAEILIENFYDVVPDDLEKALEKAMEFYRCGKDSDNNQSNEKVCDFERDADYIYSALLKKGIDLDKCDNMHWWTFMSHFSEIDNSTFNRIVYLRMKNKKGKLTKEEREECDHLGWNVINMRDNSKDDDIEAYLLGDD